MDNSNNFSVSGPVHLKTVDWKNPDHRRSVVASLVKGVYSLAEYDSHGHQNVVAPWWDSFDFELIRVLRNVDDSVITAIYEYKYPPSSPNAPSPRYVIAFRGIILKRPTRSQDMTSCIRYILNNLQGDHRFQSALDDVQKIIEASAEDPNRVWLAGHSLESAIALVVGKNMAKNGFVLKNTYLFNPPFIGLPIELIKSKKLIKKGMRIVITFVKAGVCHAVEGGDHPYHSDQSFDALSDWFPHLFVNPADPICAEYIGYFGNREVMKRIGAGKIEWHATKISLTSIFSSALTGGDPEALHLLPSAHLTINNNSTPNMIKGVRKFLDSSKKEHFKGAHAINQWWDPSFSGESNYYYHGQHGQLNT